MLWDESFQSWAQLGVSLQPSAKLYAADGTLLQEWLGPFDEEEVLALVEGAAVADAAAGDSSIGADRFCRYVSRFARAQTDAANYATADAVGRQRIVDDLRYAANAMAQTGPGEVGIAARELATAVRDYAQVIVDSDLPDDLPAADIASETDLVRAALVANQGVLRSECAVEILVEETPVVVG